MRKDSTTTSLDSEIMSNSVKMKPRTSTLELIKQYARVCTPLQSTPFSQLIAN